MVASPKFYLATPLLIIIVPDHNLSFYLTLDKIPNQTLHEKFSSFGPMHTQKNDFRSTALKRPVGRTVDISVYFVQMILTEHNNQNNALRVPSSYQEYFTF